MVNLEWLPERFVVSKQIVGTNIVLVNDQDRAYCPNCRHTDKNTDYCNNCGYYINADNQYIAIYGDTIDHEFLEFFLQNNPKIKHSIGVLATSTYTDKRAWAVLDIELQNIKKSLSVDDKIHLLINLIEAIQSIRECSLLCPLKIRGIFGEQVWLVKNQDNIPDTDIVKAFAEKLFNGFNPLTLPKSIRILLTAKSLSWKDILRIKSEHKNSTLKITVEASTDKGLIRETQQDSTAYIYCKTIIDSKPEELYICSVSDGMGGLKDGQIASRISIFINELIVTNMYIFPNLSIPKISEKAVRMVNKLILTKAASLSCNMGSTLITAVIEVSKKICHIAHVGDSRGLLIDETGYTALTKDHNLLNLKLAQNEPISETENKKLEALTNSLGIPDNQLYVDYTTVMLGHGDIIALYTDGLYKMLPDDEIMKIIKEHPIDEAVKKLINAANDKGGVDNIGIILILGKGK